MLSDGVMLMGGDVMLMVLMCLSVLRMMDGGGMMEKIFNGAGVACAASSTAS